MKILIIGDSPFLHTGFGRLTREIGYSLSQKHEVRYIGFWDQRGNDDIKTSNGYFIKERVYGIRSKYINTFAQTRYYEILDEFIPDAILCVSDLYLVEPFININRDILKLFYFHLEAEPLPIVTPGQVGTVNWPETLLKCDYVIFAGKFSKETTFKRLRTYVKEKNIDVDIDQLEKKWPIIANGVDLSVFYPLPKDEKRTLCTKLWKIPENSFVIGYFGRQNARKGIPFALEAFAKWPNRPENAYFYCHTPIEDKSGWDLMQLIKDLQIESKVIVHPHLSVGAGVSEDELNKLYNACAVICNPSTSEGFGQAACHLPGTIVKTETGHKPIESILPGEKVFTHRCRFKTVLATYKTWYEGTIVRIHTQYSPPVECTRTHKFLSADGFNGAYKLEPNMKFKYPIDKNGGRGWEIYLKEYENAVGRIWKFETCSANVAFMTRDIHLRKYAQQSLVVIRKYQNRYAVFIKWPVIVDKSYKQVRTNEEFTERYFDSKITRIETIKKFKGFVYNLNVETDHTYAVNGCASSHNCQSFATGTPIILTNYSEMAHFEKAHKIEPVGYYIETVSNFRRAIPDINGLIECYQKLYYEFMNGRLDVCGPELRAYAEQNFDARIIQEKWDQFFASIEKSAYRTKNLPQELVSIVLPAYNSNPDELAKAIESVCNQTYPHWELIIVDDGSTKREHFAVLESVRNNDKIKVIYSEKNQGIAQATTIGCQHASGDYIGFLDHDDMLSPWALEFTVQFLNAHQQYGAVFSDEKLIDKEGNTIHPIYKEDYNEDLLLAMMYINHFTLYRAYIVKEFLPLRYPGAQDYDLALRVSEKYKFGHIRECLYYWRKSDTSTTSKGISEAIVQNNKNALADALKRRHIDADIRVGPMVTQWHVNRKLKAVEGCSIIILTKDKYELICPCIESILKHTNLPYEIIIVDTGSTDHKVLDFYQKLRAYQNISIIYEPFHFSKNNNKASLLAKYPYICFLNNDTVATPNWLVEMMKQIQRPEVGVVGPKLLFPNNTIQHAGLVLGIGGLAYHMHIGKPSTAAETMFIREVSAVTGACLLTKKDMFFNVGRFDEEYMIEFQDVDYCLKVRQKGFKVIYTPYAVLYHYTSVTRGNPSYTEALNDRGRFAYKWFDEITKLDINITKTMIDTTNYQKCMRLKSLYEQMMQSSAIQKG